MSTLDVVAAFVGIPLLAFLVISAAVMWLTRPRALDSKTAPNGAAGRECDR